MAVWSSTDISRFLTQGESRFTEEMPCLVDRVALSVVLGTANYTLPTNVKSIRRITYKGWKLDPISQRDLRGTLMSGTQSGRPRFYNYTNIGKQVIQLFPVPVENVASISGPALWGSSIGDAVIVEFYAIADTVNTLPSYFRRRFLKAFALWRCFLMEGKGQNVKAAQFYGKKWAFLKERYTDLLYGLINNPRSLTTDPYVKELPIPPFARLPIDKFGISVEDEY